MVSPEIVKIVNQLLADPIIAGAIDHVETMNDEFGGIQTDVAVLKMQMTQIAWIVKTIAVAMIGMIVSQTYQIFQSHKKK